LRFKLNISLPFHFEKIGGCFSSMSG